MERVSYHRLARRELNEAAQYYESESPGLGAAFLDEVERCTQAIVTFPEAAPLITATIRRAERVNEFGTLTVGI
jgi:plasmid stabilization system protein ParE